LASLVSKLYDILGNSCEPEPLDSMAIFPSKLRLLSILIDNKAFILGLFGMGLPKVFTFNFGTRSLGIGSPLSLLFLQPDTVIAIITVQKKNSLILINYNLIRSTIRTMILH
jgi:hypothetical protein